MEPGGSWTYRAPFPRMSNRVIRSFSHAKIEQRMFTGVQGGPLTQMLSMIVLGDYISYYMGLLNEIDPSETPNIDQLKERLSGPGPG